MSQALLVSSDEEEGELCPVCAEVLTPDDLHFIPCPCGFQVSLAPHPTAAARQR